MDISYDQKKFTIGTHVGYVSRNAGGERHHKFLLLKNAFNFRCEMHEYY